MFKLKLLAPVTILGIAMSGQVRAEPIDGIFEPFMQAGRPGNLSGVPAIYAPGDTPSARVDANVPSSPFSGVVSLNVRYYVPGNPVQQSGICTGVLIDATHVLTAAHCVDTDGHGSTIDLHAPGSDVRVVFNSSGDGIVYDGNGVAQPGFPSSVITASRVVKNPNFDGFGVCPSNVTRAGAKCYGDDLATIELSEPAPVDAQIYSIHQGAVAPMTTKFTLVGYGQSGDGLNGFNPALPPSFTVKRFGTNMYEGYDYDDETNFATSSPREVWYADFDGAVPRAGGGASKVDNFCVTQGAAYCNNDSGNLTETMIGPGDSGGPAFIQMTPNGPYELAGIGAFGSSTGTFGSVFGGVLLASYTDWIAAAIPEPGMIGLFGVGALALAARRRRTV